MPAQEISPPNWSTTPTNGSRDPSDLINRAIVGTGAAMNRNTIAAAKFQQQQERLPLQDALDTARLEKERAQVELAGRSQLYTEWKDAQLAHEKAAFWAGLPELENSLKDAGHQIGSQGYVDAFATYVSKFPWAREDSAITDVIKAHTKVNDTQARFQQNLDVLNSQKLKTGQSAEIDAQGRPIVRGGAEVPSSALERYARVKGDFAFHDAQRQAEIKRQETLNAAKNPDVKDSKVPYNPLDATAAPIEANYIANKTELGLLEKNFPALAGAGADTSAAAATSVSAPGTPATNAAVAQASPTPHPMEGKAVRNNSTGALGTITNGQFVSNEQ
jgi:hypothetical protein